MPYHVFRHLSAITAVRPRESDVERSYNYLDMHMETAGQNDIPGKIYIHVYRLSN